MPPKTVKLALAEALENLTKGDFEKFCYQLLDRREEPRVVRSKVEDKNRLQVTDVLVSYFTEKGALRVTVDILKQIGCSEEAQNLESHVGEQSSKPGPSDASGGAAGGCKMADGKHFVDKHRMDLVRRVSNISPILDELLHREVIGNEVYNHIRVQPTSQEKMRALYDKSMNSDGSKDNFYEILLVHEKFLIEELQKMK